MKLFIGTQIFYNVSSLKEASELWRTYDNAECKDGRGGARRMPPVFVYDDGERIARISYNGRVWDNNDNEIQLI